MPDKNFQADSSMEVLFLIRKECCIKSSYFDTVSGSTCCRFSTNLEGSKLPQIGKDIKHIWEFKSLVYCFFHAYCMNPELGWSSGVPTHF